MTDLEIRAAIRLGKCRFPRGLWEKRFARDLYRLATEDSGRGLSAKQRIWLWRLVWKYRRQIRGKDAAIVEVAREEARFDAPALFRDAW